MTTDNTQELSKLLNKYFEHAYIAGAMDEQSNSEAASMNTKKCHELKQQIIDWHNKQVEAVLDRLQEKQRDWMHEHAELKLGYATYLLSAIEAERNKLKESK